MAADGPRDARSPLRIGITGHRMLPEPAAVRLGLAATFREIAGQFPHRPWRLLSGLAEGADRLAVLEAERFGPVSLTVPLPLPIEDYLADFSGPESREQFLALLARAAEVIPPAAAGRREDGYRNIGRWIVDHCDILLGVWDGLPPRGPGGTGEVIGLARSRGLPVFVVPCRRPAG